MIEKMQKVFIYSLKKELTSVMEQIIKCGVLQPEKAEVMIPKEMEKLLDKGRDFDISQQHELLMTIEECIDTVRPFGTKRGILYKRPTISYEEFVSEDTLSYGVEICREIKHITKKINETEKQLKNLRFRRNSLLPWTSFDMEPSKAQTSETCMKLYIFKEHADLNEIPISFQKQDVDLHAEMVNEDHGNHYMAVLFRKSQMEGVIKLAETMGAVEFSQMPEKGTFEDEVMRMDEEIHRLENIEKDLQETLREMASKRYILERARDFMALKIKCLSDRQHMLATKQVSIMAGWVPVSCRRKLEECLEEYDCFCQYREPEPYEEPPVLMKNNSVVAPFSAITEMYSLPSPHSIDTNWLIGLFFFVFFGMMLSDAGYGLVLMAVGLCGAGLLDVGETAGQMMKMIGICGISTVFWGILYGSYFGDAIPIISETFFHREITLPRLMDPLEQPMEVLLMACALGIVHIFAGMALKAYIIIRRGDKWGALFDVGFWYMVLGGLLLIPVSGIWSRVGIMISAAGGIGLVFTQGRHRDGIFRRVTAGFMSLYGITGYFSDILSYSRILALGLATGVVASVVNIMASMAGGGIWGVLLFAVIFAVGHTLNLAINALGAYVHAARLQYVEFFGKYYEGGGRKFRPLEIDAKYVRVMGEK